ncbi:MAG: YlbF family regulator [Clostridia bacterium]|nr:YlbF family regulator [Clostridia bacterium]
MDQLIEMAKEMGEAIQMDERFIRTQMAQAAADEDEELQGMIGEFNLKRLAINNEYTKDEQDGEKLREMEHELRAVYARLMENEHMKAYQEAKSELDQVMSRINRILTLSAQGENPYEADVDPSGCSGNCGTCGGCH